MTKNHILIQSVTLGLLLIFAAPTKAQAADQVLVQYFNKLYIGSSPKCSVNDPTKAQIIGELEEKCLIRNVSDKGSFISGVKSACSEASVKTAVDAKVNALCENSAVKANAVGIAKQAEQQKQAAAKQNGGGGGSAPSGVEMASQGLQLAAQFAAVAADKYDKKSPQSETSEKSGTGTSSKSADSSGSESVQKQPSVTLDNAPPPRPSEAKYALPEGGYIVAKTDAEGTTLTKYDKSGVYVPDPQGEHSGVLPPAHVDSKIKAMGADPSKPTYPPDAQTQELVKNAPKELKPSAEKVADGSGATGTDPALEAKQTKANADDQALEKELQTIKAQIDAAKAAAPNEATQKCNANEATRDPITGQTKNPALEKECMIGEPQKAIICLETNYQQLEADKIKLMEQKTSCSSSSTQAEKLCSMVRSEKAQQVQFFMSAGATILSKVTAASEACGTTSTLSKIAQGGMLAAQGACTAMKFRCDFSCGAAEKTLANMKLKSEAIQKCQLTLQAIAQAGSEALTAAKQLSTKLDLELKPKQGAVPVAIEQCIAHKVDIANMGLAALGFLSAFQDAETCKKQLASGEGNGAPGKSTSSLAGPQMTTAEYCSMPANAASLTCKCTTNPNADGCMGSLAKSGVNIGKINPGSGPSSFASANQNGLGAVDSLGKAPVNSDELPPGANLSEAAREALGIGTAPAGGDLGGSTAAGASAAEAAKKPKSDEEKEKAKYGFFSSLGNMISGGKAPSQAANAAIRKFEQEQAIKRKLASDQVRAEISTASGKSNFDKIRNRYQQNAASFEQ